MRNDVAHGFGKLEFKDGSSYEGGSFLMNFMERENILFLMEGLSKGNGQMDFFMKEAGNLLMVTNMR